MHVGVQDRRQHLPHPVYFRKRRTCEPGTELLGRQLARVNRPCGGRRCGSGYAGYGQGSPHRTEEGGTGVPLLRGQQHRGKGGFNLPAGSHVVPLSEVPPKDHLPAAEPGRREWLSSPTVPHAPHLWILQSDCAVSRQRYHIVFVTRQLCQLLCLLHVVQTRREYMPVTPPPKSYCYSLTLSSINFLQNHTL